MKRIENRRSGRKAGVLVAGAHSMGALGVIRSLGRAGYSVHAVAASRDAIGLHSNFVATSTIHPHSDSPLFVKWVSDFIHKNEIKMIIPGGPISSGHPAFKEYEHLFPVSRKNTSNVLAKGRKYELFESLLAGNETHRDNLPPIILIEFKKGLPSQSDLSNLGSPIFIKLDGHHSSTGKGDRVIRSPTAREALQQLKLLKSDYRRAVVQGFVPGSGVGVFFLRWNKEIRARFMHRRLHEMPHTGGASSLRESWWNDEIADDAERKLSLINWEGVAMVEYRWNPSTNRFFLMEMNLRFWGSIHLALYSGVDFPKLLADSFLGYEIIPERVRPIIGLKCRNTIPYEIGYLVSLWRDKQVPLSPKLYSIWEAIWLSLDFRIRNDLLFPGDRKLFWYRLGKFLRTGQ